MCLLQFTSITLPYFTKRNHNQHDERSTQNAELTETSRKRFAKGNTKQVCILSRGYFCYFCIILSLLDSVQHEEVVFRCRFLCFGAFYLKHYGSFSPNFLINHFFRVRFEICFSGSSNASTANEVIVILPIYTYLVQFARFPSR